MEAFVTSPIAKDFGPWSSSQEAPGQRAETAFYGSRVSASDPSRVHIRRIASAQHIRTRGSQIWSVEAPKAERQRANVALTPPSGQPAPALDGTSEPELQALAERLRFAQSHLKSQLNPKIGTLDKRALLMAQAAATAATAAEHALTSHTLTMLRRQRKEADAEADILREQLLAADARARRAKWDHEQESEFIQQDHRVKLSKMQLSLNEALSKITLLEDTAKADAEVRRAMPALSNREALLLPRLRL